MNQFIQAFDELVEEQTLSSDFESELIEHIFEQSIFTDAEEFSRNNITQDDAEAIALSNKYFISDYFESAELDYNLITTGITQHPEKFAYHLAYTSPEIGKQLLDELLYYRSVGRI